MLDFNDYALHIKDQLSQIRGQLEFTNEILEKEIKDTVLVPSDVDDLISRCQLLQIKAKNDCQKKLLKSLVNISNKFIEEHPNIKDEKYLDELSIFNNTNSNHGYYY